MFRRLAAGLLVVLAGIGLTGCNGNLDPVDNCNASLGLLNSSVVANGGSWGLYDATYIQFGSPHPQKQYSCQAISFDGIGYDGFIHWFIIDKDPVLGGDADGSWFVSSPITSGGQRFNLPNTAVFCEMKRVAPFPGGGCDLHPNP